ncbi:MAG: MFS transporter, partial [Candidatus Paceibacterota bacterium]
MPVFNIAVQSAFSRERLGEVTASVQLARNVGGTVGTAILGGVMNAQLTKHLSNIGSDPFVVAMKSIDPNSAIGNINNDTIQGVLNPAVQDQIRAGLAHSPAVEQLMLAFDTFLATVKLAFSQSVDQVFFVGFLLMAVAFAVVWFLPEIPLRSSNRPASEEVGVEMEEEFGSGIMAH